MAKPEDSNAFDILVTDLIKGYVDVDTNDPRNVVGLTATNGTLTKVDNTKYTFKPNADYVGTVDLNYTITDGRVEVLMFQILLPLARLMMHQSEQLVM